MTKKTGHEFRAEEAWRASFPCEGRWGIPLVRRQPWVGGDEEHDGEVGLISFSDTTQHDERNAWRGVHFFVDDPRFEGVWRHPDRSLSKLRQYRFVLTPDFSVYGDMRPWRQLQSVAQGRWCGAWWQSQGLAVYPTMSWGTPQSWEFCFASVERGCTVAVATYACRNAERLFMAGYAEMLRQVGPERVICLGEPFDGMREAGRELVVVDAARARKVAR